MLRLWPACSKLVGGPSTSSPAPYICECCSFEKRLLLRTDGTSSGPEIAGGSVKFDDALRDIDLLRFDEDADEDKGGYGECDCE